MEDISALKQMLVMASRILANEGLTKAFGHISVRIPDSDRFLIPCRMSPALVGFENILTMNLDGEKVAGQGVPNSETVIHSSVYRARPEVNSVAHTHSHKAVILASAGQTLKPLTHAHLDFSDGVPLYTRPGQILTPQQGAALARKLGKHKAVLLRGHGAVIAGPSLQQTCLWAITLEEACDFQFWITLLGTPRYFTRAELKAVSAGPGQNRQPKRAWDYYAGRLSSIK